jgi:hypothetical protein
LYDKSSDHESSISSLPSQLNEFSQFIFKSSRYSSEQLFGASDEHSAKKKAILVVKDIPNAAFYNIIKFHELLKNFSKYSMRSLIFLINTTGFVNNQTETNVSKLFTSEIKQQLGVIEVNFNPIAVTYMSKHIEKLAKLEDLKFVDKSFVKDICDKSNGDLRYALNLLELSYSKTFSSRLPLKEKQYDVPRTSKNSSSIRIRKFKTENYKDINGNLFKNLGKILHRKNAEKNDADDDGDEPDQYDKRLSIENNMPNHLIKLNLKREPLKYSPEEVYRKMSIKASSLVSLLNQNYLEIYLFKSRNSNDQMERLEHISDCFIDSDRIISTAASHMSDSPISNDMLNEEASLMSMRSILFYMCFKETQQNSQQASESSAKSVWTPLQRPLHNKINEIKSLNSKKLDQLISDYFNSYSCCGSATEEVSKYSNMTSLLKYLISMKDDIYVTLVPYLYMNSNKTKGAHTKDEYRSFIYKLAEMFSFKSKSAASLRFNMSKNAVNNRFNENEFVCDDDEEKAEESHQKNTKNMQPHEHQTMARESLKNVINTTGAFSYEAGKDLLIEDAF